MAKAIQYGCKKCGGVVTVEVHPWTDHADAKVKDGKVHDNFGTIEIQCKKCNKAVAKLNIAQV